MAQYAVGDIHGCLRTARALVEDRLGLTTSDTLILMGDYVDRGPDSRGVLAWIRDLDAGGYRVIPLRGNHDDMVVRARFSERWRASALRNGGLATLASWEVDSHTGIPQHDADMIDALPLWHVDERYLYVHASFAADSPLPWLETHVMLFGRTEEATAMGRRIVCGHTPQSPDDIRRRIDDGSKIIVDAGVCYPERPGMGSLCALDLDTLVPVFQRNLDMMP